MTKHCFSIYILTALFMRFVPGMYLQNKTTIFRSLSAGALECS